MKKMSGLVFLCVLKACKSGEMMEESYDKLWSIILYQPNSYGSYCDI